MHVNIEHWLWAASHSATSAQSLLYLRQVFCWFFWNLLIYFEDTDGHQEYSATISDLHRTQSYIALCHHVLMRHAHCAYIIVFFYFQVIYDIHVFICMYTYIYIYHHHIYIHIYIWINTWYDVIWLHIYLHVYIYIYICVCVICGHSISQSPW